jgi:membrane fusion protein (multidrug efflux system)
MPVEVDTVRRGTLTLQVEATGRVEADRRARLAATVSGNVAFVMVDEGDFVSSGQALLRLDPGALALDVERAQADLEAAEARYRDLILFDEEITDAALRRERSKAARVRSGLEQAEVAFREAHRALAASTLRAPFSGRIAELRIARGEHVSSGEDLLTVVDLDPVRVQVEVVESELRWLQEGGGAAVRLLAFPDTIHRGRIVAISPVIDPEGRMGRVTVVVSNPDGAILPGMYARVALQGRSFADRLVVPEEAIVEREGKAIVFVFQPGSRGHTDEGRAKWVYVSTGLADDRRVEVLAGPGPPPIEPGDLILTAGHVTLVHDARVRITGPGIAPPSP